MHFNRHRRTMADTGLHTECEVMLGAKRRCKRLAQLHIGLVANTWSETRTDRLRVSIQYIWSFENLLLINDKHLSANGEVEIKEKEERKKRERDCGNAAFASDLQIGTAVKSEHMPMGATNICSNCMVDLFCMVNPFAQWLNSYQESHCSGLF